jgi:hypothetical protein
MTPSFHEPCYRLCRQLEALPLLIALCLLAVGGCSSTPESAWQGDPVPPPDLEAMARAVFTGRTCPTAAEATELLEAGLRQLGYPGWEVTRDAGVTDTSCVGGTIDTVASQVRLTQALGPDLMSVIDDLRARLMDTCLDAGEAAALARSALESHGVVDPDIRTDGPVGGPLDQLDAIQQHVDDGCFIYATVGYTAEGHRIFYLAGKQQ